MIAPSHPEFPHLFFSLHSISFSFFFEIFLCFPLFVVRFARFAKLHSKRPSCVKSQVDQPMHLYLFICICWFVSMHLYMYVFVFLYLSICLFHFFLWVYYSIYLFRFLFFLLISKIQHTRNFMFIYLENNTVILYKSQNCI